MAIWLKMAIEIVDLPIKNGGVPVCCVNVYQRLPWDKLRKDVES